MEDLIREMAYWGAPEQELLKLLGEYEADLKKRLWHDFMECLQVVMLGILATGIEFTNEEFAKLVYNGMGEI